MKIIFVWLLAIVFLIDSVLRAIRSSFSCSICAAVSTGRSVRSSALDPALHQSFR